MRYRELAEEVEELEEVRGEASRGRNAAVMADMVLRGFAWGFITGAGLAAGDVCAVVIGVVELVVVVVVVVAVSLTVRDAEMGDSEPVPSPTIAPTNPPVLPGFRGGMSMSMAVCSLSVDAPVFPDSVVEEPWRDEDSGEPMVRLLAGEAAPEVAVDVVAMFGGSQSALFARTGQQHPAGARIEGVW